MAIADKLIQNRDNRFFWISMQYSPYFLFYYFYFCSIHSQVVDLNHPLYNEEKTMLNFPTE